MDAERRGSRWLHAQPSEDDVRDWFARQPLHEGMDHDRYVSGIVLISANEKVKVTKQKQNGDPYTAEVEHAVYTPYVKVDTRIAYFWDLVRLLNGNSLLGDYVGVIEPVPTPRIEDPASAYYNAHLPDGFFIQPVRNGNDSISRFVACKSRVAIHERSLWTEGVRDRPLMSGVGTKQTPLARQWADDNALMKAETGSVGRALGMAGILVIGTGVATAEDMQEAAAGPSGASAASAAGATLPPEAPAADAAGGAAVPEEQAKEGAENPEQGRTFANDEELRAYARELAGDFSRDFPPQWAAFQRWWNEDRKLGEINGLSGPVLRGVVTKLERDLDACRQAAVAA